jgi:hypothetical protein
MALVAILRAAFPGREWGAMTVQLYAQVLTEFEPQDGKTAIEDLIRRSSWCPAVADVVSTCREYRNARRGERIEVERLELEEAIAATPDEVKTILQGYWASLEEGTLAKARLASAKAADHGTFEERRQVALAYIDKALAEEGRAPPVPKPRAGRMAGICPGIGQLAVRRHADGVMVCRGCGSPIEVGCGGRAGGREPEDEGGTVEGDGGAGSEAPGADEADEE